MAHAHGLRHTMLHPLFWINFRDIYWVGYLHLGDRIPLCIRYTSNVSITYTRNDKDQVMYKLMYISCLLTVTDHYLSYWYCLHHVWHWCRIKAYNTLSGHHLLQQSMSNTLICRHCSMLARICDVQIRHPVFPSDLLVTPSFSFAKYITVAL